MFVSRMKALRERRRVYQILFIAHTDPFSLRDLFRVLFRSLLTVSVKTTGRCTSVFSLTVLNWSLFVLAIWLTCWVPPFNIIWGKLCSSSSLEAIAAESICWSYLWTIDTASLMSKTWMIINQPFELQDRLASLNLLTSIASLSTCRRLRLSSDVLSSSNCPNFSHRRSVSVSESSISTYILRMDSEWLNKDARHIGQYVCGRWFRHSRQNTCPQGVQQHSRLEVKFSKHISQVEDGSIIRGMG